MTQQQQSREFDVSDLSSIPWLGKRKELRVNACKNRPKSPISGTSREIDFAFILPTDRS